MNFSRFYAFLMCLAVFGGCNAASTSSESAMAIAQKDKKLDIYELVTDLDFDSFGLSIEDAITGELTRLPNIDRAEWERLSKAAVDSLKKNSGRTFAPIAFLRITSGPCEIRIYILEPNIRKMITEMQAD